MARYNFTLHAKMVAGDMVGLAFLTSWFAADVDALAFATWLNNTALANYAKVSVSKVILDCTEADFQILAEDSPVVDIQKMKMLLGHQGNDDMTVQMTLRGLKASITPADALAAIVAANMQNKDGLTLDKLITAQQSYQNIVEGGPV